MIRFSVTERPEQLTINRDKFLNLKNTRCRMIVEIQQKKKKATTLPVRNHMHKGGENCRRTASVRQVLQWPPAVYQIGAFFLHPAYAAGERALHLTLHTKCIVRRHSPKPLLLRIARRQPPLRTPGRSPPLPGPPRLLKLVRRRHRRRPAGSKVALRGTRRTGRSPSRTPDLRAVPRPSSSPLEPMRRSWVRRSAVRFALQQRWQVDADAEGGAAWPFSASYGHRPGRSSHLSLALSLSHSLSIPVFFFWSKGHGKGLLRMLGRPWRSIRDCLVFDPEFERLSGSFWMALRWLN